MGVYEHLSQTQSKCIDVIEKDLKRTFLGKESNLKYEQLLRRILVAFSNLVPQIGYTQGMNYIAGFILQQFFEQTPSINAETMDDYKQNEYELIQSDLDLQTFNHNNHRLVEEKTFWTFVSIMNKIGTLFSDKLPGFMKSVECFKNILSYHAPTDLVHHLNELNVHPIMLSGWFHSLFTYPSMNKNIAKRIWDVFVIEQMDFSIIIKISYLIVIRHEEHLKQMDFVQIIEFCKSNQCFIFNKKDDHDLIYRTSKLNLNELYLSPMRNLKYVDIGNNEKNENNECKENTEKQGTEDTLFENKNNRINISASSIHSNSSTSSMSYVKLKKVNAIDHDDKNEEDANQSWKSILTFGYAK